MLHTDRTASNRIVAPALLVALALAACGADPSSAPTPTPDAGQAPRPDAGEDPTRPDAGPIMADAGTSEPTPHDGGVVAPIDAGSPPERCDRATATIGATGGVLELCGAKVTVPAGALSHDVELSIAQVDPGVAIPAPFVRVGPAWRIEPADLAGYAELELPHAEGWTDDLELVYLLEGAWSVHGACRQTERAVEMKVWDLGTFALVRDPRGMPTSPYGLGEGTATLTLDGRALTLTTGELGYAGVHETLSGFEVFGFQADLASEQVTAIVELAVQGERVIPSMIAVIDDLRSLFIAYDWVTGSGLVDVELDVVDGRWNVRLTGALLDDAHDEVPFTMTLEARPLAWSPLPSRICED